MQVRELDEDQDWKFGYGKANYIKDNNAILQNVQTRLKSFKNDWFLDQDANIDWFNILGQKDTKETIIKEVERVTLQTEGVTRINLIEITTDNKTRNAKINIDLDTIYTINNSLGVSV
jgi:hypothetical protein